MELENKSDKTEFNINNQDKENISKLNSSLQTILENRKCRFQNVSDYLEKLPKLNNIFKKLKK